MTDQTPLVRRYEVTICDDCIKLLGQMCNNPYCIFCRRTITEVASFLDVLLIRPIVGGQQIISAAEAMEFAREDR